MRTFTFFFMIALGACSSSSTNTEGTPCGVNTCAEGLVCCNESCGICAPPDADCPAVECEDPTVPQCEPMDAASEGECETDLGYSFDGETCVALTGCSCEGEDCDALFESLAECEDECVISEEGDSCGGLEDAACSVGFYCAYEVGSECTGEGTCQRFVPSECFGAPATVCGCDGVEYVSACAARAAGTDVANLGPCPEDVE
jgi:hypothetical protein